MSTKKLVKWRPLAPGELPPEKNPLLLYLARLAESGRRTQKIALEELAQLYAGFSAVEFPWHRLTYALVEMMRAVLVDRATAASAATSTVNRKLAALKGVCKRAFLLGMLSGDEWLKIQEVESVKGTGTQRGREISDDEIKKLFVHCQAAWQDNQDGKHGGVTGLRDAAMLALLFGGAMRRDEAAKLKVGDYHPETNSALVRGAQQGGGGKGNKTRNVQLPALACVCVDNWLALRQGRQEPTLAPESTVLLAVNRGGKILERPMTGDTIFRACVRRAKAAGVASLAPHDFRRTAATKMLFSTGDLVVVRNALGHSSVKTTEIYDKRGELAVRGAVDTLDKFFRRD